MRWFDTRWRFLSIGWDFRVFFRKNYTCGYCCIIIKIFLYAGNGGSLEGWGGGNNKLILKIFVYVTEISETIMSNADLDQ